MARCLSAYRWQAPSEIVETLRRARVIVTIDQVEDELVAMDRVVESGGRYRRA